MIIAKRCFVSGRVQGVFYRASAQQEANRLGVRGYAKNLADGRVEVLALGDTQALAAFLRFLWTASPMAHVTTVDVREVELSQLAPTPRAFETL